MQDMDGDSEDDQRLGEAAEALEGQNAHQIQLSGASQAPVQRHFEFQRRPVVNRRSVHMGVRVRVFQLRPRQIGSFPGQQLAEALVQGLRDALDDFISDEDIPDEDRIYVALASNRLANAYNGWG